jgi:HPt (histidine-containing phosphotransfer) domain-containing protein
MTPPPPPPDESEGDALGSFSGPVNPKTIRELREMAGEEGYLQIRAEFLSSTARSLGEMARAAESGDADVLRRKLHGLKGASGSLGAALLESMCRALERTIAASPRAERVAAVARVAAEFEAVRRALTEDA